ncbi:MAG: hypothetical protein IIB95_03555 [Candidatus Marinimicrobia bacterium]|nr:hypothetical protein [Candidatus Neomarinimicrobiota bacterium]
MKSKAIQTIVFLLPIISTLTAQPSFPSTPNQAPIGGLGLLALAGGAIALKKLLDRNRDKD